MQNREDDTIKGATAIKPIRGYAMGGDISIKAPDDKPPPGMQFGDEDTIKGATAIKP